MAGIICINIKTVKTSQVMWSGMELNLQPVIINWQTAALTHRDKSSIESASCVGLAIFQ